MFGPQLRDIAVRQIRSPENERNIQSVLAHERNLLSRCALQDVQCDVGVARVEGPDDFAEKAGCHRR
jgi:hypothetical protein